MKEFTQSLASTRSVMIIGRLMKSGAICLNASDGEGNCAEGKNKRSMENLLTFFFLLEDFRLSDVLLND
jgi:hypothetical protein